MTDEELIRQAVEEALARKAGEGNDLPQPPAALKLNVGGQDVEFKDINHLSQTLDQTLGTWNTQKAELEAKVAALEEAAKNSANRVTGDEVKDKTVAFDEEAWKARFVKNPVDGLKELMTYVVQDKAPGSIGEQLAFQRAQTEDIRRGVVIQQFLALHPEFKTGPQGAIVADINQKLGYNFDVPGLEAAYGVAIARNLLPPPQLLQFQEQQQQQQQRNAPDPRQQQQQQYQLNSAFAPGPSGFNGGAGWAPPNVGRGGAGGPLAPDIANAAESMTAEQLAAVIQRLSPQ